MNAGPTSARVYEVLRGRLHRRGLPPGTRLDPAVLADELGVSPTPVRDALHILAGEDIVVAGTTGGFTVPLIDQPSLIDLYRWNGDVLLMALKRQQPPILVKPSGSLTRDSTPIADLISGLFLLITNRSMNFEHSRVQARTNDRLYAARLAESHVMPNLEEEWFDMEACYHLNDLVEMRKLVARYTKRREAESGNIIHHLYRSDSI